MKQKKIQRDTGEKPTSEPALYGTGSYKIRLAIGYGEKDRLWYVAELSDSLSILARGYGKTIAKALKDLERRMEKR